MFTGIISHLGTILEVKESGTNKVFEIEAALEEPIQVDQSIAHNGVCLTVDQLHPLSASGKQRYTVIAVKETLEKSNLGSLKKGSQVNLELSMRVGDRLDGHFVQGHVDDTGQVKEVSELDGSWMYYFQINPRWKHLLVDKGSICINGVSLTLVECKEDTFSVTIIPYTYHHTTFQDLRPGDLVNLEFDILGKYMAKFQQSYLSS